ncbi:hypothetical protein MHZ92_02685 [Sporosarcina sp. ACRSL]|uniref:hypothetical protein n=1 Tax=Sporosarcina sp. ACRSL TaxID=2918215 RepID=UPI001EF60F1D|nr:hypothetical protein [Sporosarcina sp. ACRSL]MCG7343022.1 hypothetical protein [Sporosarcina sp. ACRSL]
MKLNKKSTSLLLFAASILLLLSGCMYPADEKAVRENPYEEQLETIQKAVYTYKENNGGLLPIKTRDQETDLYIKYPIEFSKIVPAYTEKIPSNAYETGGIYQYVLMDVEDNPTVKLVDLRIAERIRELNLRKFINGKLPFKDPVGENVYEIDFEAMGFKEPLKVESPYSDAQLPIVVGGDGNFYVDYSIDLNRILQEEKPDVKEGEDIRYILFESNPILPAYSLPYTVNEKNEPVFMKKK